jgi:hypothetical protein
MSDESDQSSFFRNRKALLVKMATPNTASAAI